MVELLLQIERRVEKWLRRHDSGAWAGDVLVEGRPGAGGLTAHLAEAREALRKLRDSIAELEGKLKRDEAELGVGRPPCSKAARAGTAGAEKPRLTRARGECHDRVSWV